MGQPENLFIKRLHKRLPPLPAPVLDIPDSTDPRTLYHEKMHNEYRGGTADVWYSGARDLWVEYKWVKKLPKLIKPDLSTNQVIWLNGRWLESRNVAAVVGSPDGCVVFAMPQQWLYGVARDEAQVLSEDEVALWIQAECGLAPSQGRQSEQRTSMPLSSTAC